MTLEQTYNHLVHEPYFLRGQDFANIPFDQLENRIQAAGPSLDPETLSSAERKELMRYKTPLENFINALFQQAYAAIDHRRRNRLASALALHGAYLRLPHLKA